LRIYKNKGVVALGKTLKEHPCLNLLLMAMGVSYFKIKNMDLDINNLDGSNESRIELKERLFRQYLSVYTEIQQEALETIQESTSKSDKKQGFEILITGSLFRVARNIETLNEIIGDGDDSSYKYLYDAGTMIMSDPSKEHIDLCVLALDDAIRSRLEIMATAIGDEDLINGLLDMGDMNNPVQQFEAVNFFEECISRVSKAE